MRFRNDAFTIEWNGDAVARLAPVPTATVTKALEAFRAWTEAGSTDAAIADDLARLGELDTFPRDPWASWSIPAPSSRSSGHGALEAILGPAGSQQLVTPAIVLTEPLVVCGWRRHPRRQPPVVGVSTRPWSGCRSWTSQRPTRSAGRSCSPS